MKTPWEVFFFIKGEKNGKKKREKERKEHWISDPKECGSGREEHEDVVVEQGPWAMRAQSPWSTSAGARVRALTPLFHHVILQPLATITATATTTLQSSPLYILHYIIFFYCYYCNYYCSFHLSSFCPGLLFLTNLLCYKKKNKKKGGSSVYHCKRLFNSVYQVTKIIFFCMSL